MRCQKALRRGFASRLCVEALRSSHAFTDLERRACEAMDGHPVHVLKVHGEYDVVMVTARREGLGVGLVCGSVVGALGVGRLGRARHRYRVRVADSVCITRVACGTAQRHTTQRLTCSAARVCARMQRSPRRRRAARRESQTSRARRRRATQGRDHPSPRVPPA